MAKSSSIFPFSIFSKFDLFSNLILFLELSADSAECPAVLAPFVTPLFPVVLPVLVPVGFLDSRRDRKREMGFMKVLVGFGA